MGTAAELSGNIPRLIKNSRELDAKEDAHWQNYLIK